MTARAVLMVTVGLATVGLCVYLFLAVNSTAAPVKDTESTQVAERAPPTPDPKPAYEKPPTPVRQHDTKDAPETRPPRVPRSPSSGESIDLDRDEVMASANKAYDRGNLDEAIEIASKVLSDDPNNVRMLRIVISASCILDDATAAQRNYLKLPPGSVDRETMKVRCARYNVTFNET